MSVSVDSGVDALTESFGDLEIDDLEDQKFDLKGELAEVDMLSAEEIRTLPIEELMLRLLKSNMQVMANGRKITVFISKLTDKQYDSLVERQSDLMKDPAWMFFRTLMVASKTFGGFAGDDIRPLLDGAFVATEGGEGYTKNMNQAERTPVDGRVSVKMYAKQKEETELQNVQGKESEAKRKRDDFLDKLSQMIMGMIKN